MFVGSLTGASVVTAMLLLMVSYSDMLDPQRYPLLCCAGMTIPFFILANLLFVPLWIFVRWQRVWIPLAAFVLTYTPIRTYVPVNVHLTQSPPEGSIKVLSYNVCGYGGNYKYDQAVDTLRGYIQRINADIVCLQEGHGGNSGNGYEMMKTLYPYNDTIHVSKGPSINAMSFHTRYPIIRKERIEYQSLTNGSIAYYLQVGADTVMVINNHLESTHLSDDERQNFKEVLKGDKETHEAKSELKAIIRKLGDKMGDRADQARAVHQYVVDHRQYPVILCGDFNDTPISYVHRTIAQNLTDCYVATGCGLGISFNPKGFSFRIDNIMCSSHFKPFGCQVDDDIDVSDHYPIFCWLTLTKTMN